MKRIAIIGIPGSGKSTFANKLGKALGRKVIHLDKHYWAPGWNKRYPEKEDWAGYVKNLIAEDEWIIDGNYQSTMDIRLARTDTIIFLDFPKWRAFWRAIVRVFDRRQPVDHPIGNKRKIDLLLVKSILKYPKHKTEALVDKYKTQAKVFRVRKNTEIKNLLTQLTK